MSNESNRLGAAGESLAAKHLESKGWTVMARNWRCRIGELDLVVARTVRRGRGKALQVAFVEVKTRRDGPAPKLSVTAEKRRRLVRLAKWYLRDLGRRAVIGRFDIVEIVWRRGSKHPKVVHHEGVFDASGRARR